VITGAQILNTQLLMGTMRLLSRYLRVSGTGRAQIAGIHFGFDATQEAQTVNADVTPPRLKRYRTRGTSRMVDNKLPGRGIKCYVSLCWLPAAEYMVIQDVNVITTDTVL